MTAGLLLFAHGARDPNWAVPFHEVVRKIEKQRPGLPVVLAFLEFMTPDIATAGASLAAQGCTQVDVVPLFLGAGGHVRKDLPELLGRLRTAYPQVEWALQPAVGEVECVISAMAKAAIRLCNIRPPDSQKSDAK
jgi:sirohydrochlorin cobaltochelatase